MGIIRLGIIIFFFVSCSGPEKVDIPVDQCNSDEIVAKFKNKTKKVLSKLSLTSSNFFDFSKMDQVRCLGFDYPAGHGPTCAKKCRPYQLETLSASSDTVEVALAHIKNEIMVVEVTWVSGAMAHPTDAPPAKLEKGKHMPSKKPIKEKPVEVKSE